MFFDFYAWWALFPLWVLSFGAFAYYFLGLIVGSFIYIYNTRGKISELEEYFLAGMFCVIVSVIWGILYLVLPMIVIGSLLVYSFSCLFKRL